MSEEQASTLVDRELPHLLPWKRVELIGRVLLAAQTAAQ